MGTTVLTTQGLLQQQRDVLIDIGKMPIINVGKKPPTFKGKRRMKKELRAGVKSGVSSDFFVPFDSNSQQGTIGLSKALQRCFKYLSQRVARLNLSQVK